MKPPRTTISFYHGPDVSRAAPPWAINGMFCKCCGVGKISKHYGVGHGSVPFRPLFYLFGGGKLNQKLTIVSKLQLRLSISNRGVGRATPGSPWVCLIWNFVLPLVCFSLNSFFVFFTNFKNAS